METCSVCGERKVVFLVANKWRCKGCGKYFDWTDIKRAKEQAGAGPGPGP